MASQNEDLDTFYCSCGDDFEKKQDLERHKMNCSTYMEQEIEEFYKSNSEIQDDESDDEGDLIETQGIKQESQDYPSAILDYQSKTSNTIISYI